MGHNVRYDGKNKFMPLSEYFDAKYYRLTPLCPEVEMGLSIPRQPIELTHKNKQLRLVQVGAHRIDHTEKMQQWVKLNKKQLSLYSGYILKSKSPSCGIQNTPHYHADGNIHLGDGLFTTLIKKSFPTITIISEHDIKQQQLLNQFKEQVKKDSITKQMSFF